MNIRLRTAAIIAVAMGLGWALRGCGREPATETGATAAQEVGREWTCSMHPQIRQPKPGQCPLCGMDLVPVATRSPRSEGGERELVLSPAARKLAEVETAVVERKFVSSEIRMVGKIAYDETRVRDVALLTEGQVTRLFVNYVGVPVKKGEHLAEVYSPEVLAASKELLVARQGGVPVEAVRRKLQLLGVSDEQIDRLLESGQPAHSFTLYSPIDGVLTEMGTYEGGWLDRGEKLGRIADNQTVWALLDAYESDIGFIHYGQPVSLTVEALPGRTFTGFVAFIPPELNENTRAIRVRLNVPNPAGALKPGMFVRALLDVKMTVDGTEIAPDLAGKWICPMHPEITGDQAGACSICGMDLVTAESLGFVNPDAVTSEAPLVIPATAPLLTGKRAIVYVAVAGREGAYEGREIELGPRAGDSYIVKSGLKEGEAVVTRGNLKIDSSVQILGKPSMMNPAAKEATSGVPAVFREHMGHVIAAYLHIVAAMSTDDTTALTAAVKQVREALDGVDMSLLDGDAHHLWMGLLDDINAPVETLDGVENSEKARVPFRDLSNALIAAVRLFGVAGDQPVYRVRCPMAFDNTGADWIQVRRDVTNPYFSGGMLRCGSLEEILSGKKD